MSTAMGSRGRAAVAAAALLGLATGSGCKPSCPLPDELDGAFTQGTACMPTNAHTTGTAAAPPSFPMRFDFCLYRCVALVPGTPALTYFWQCAGPQCEMVVLAMGHLTRVKSQSGCDGCELEDPPKDQCTPQSVSFQVEPPSQIDPATGKKSYLAKSFTVRIPYFTLEQAGQIQADLKAGKDPAMAIAAAGGGGRQASRSFTITFDPKNAPASDPAALGGGDCHAIPLP